MSVRSRYGAASRCISYESVASRNGERHRCGCEEPPFDKTACGKTIKSVNVRSSAPKSAGQGEDCAVQCATRSFRVYDTNVCIGHVLQCGNRLLRERYRLIVIGRSPRQAGEKSFTGLQQIATAASAATSHAMRHCKGHKPWLQDMKIKYNLWRYLCGISAVALRITCSLMHSRIMRQSPAQAVMCASSDQQCT